MGAAASTAPPPREVLSQEQWARMRCAWFKMFAEEDFKPRSIIQFMCKQTKTVKYGSVDRIIDPNSAFIKIAEGVFMELKKKDMIWSLVPDTCMSKAKAAISFTMDVSRTWRLWKSKHINVNP